MMVPPVAHKAHTHTDVRTYGEHAHMLDKHARCTNYAATYMRARTVRAYVRENGSSRFLSVPSRPVPCRPCGNIARAAAAICARARETKMNVYIFIRTGAHAQSAHTHTHIRYELSTSVHKLKTESAVYMAAHVSVRACMCACVRECVCWCVCRIFARIL